MRLYRLIPLAIVCAAAGARNGGGVCGTTRETGVENLFLHRQAVRARGRMQARVVTLPNQDLGDIAIVQDANGIVDRLNQFNLNGNTLVFTPDSAAAVQYRYSIAPFVHDPYTIAGTPLAALDDDDSRVVPLPFAFPFYGVVYRQVYVNSDGNLTFAAADSASSDRSLGRMTAGPPRIAPLFDDLNPGRTAGGVRFSAQAGSFTVVWSSVPEYSDSNTDAPQSFAVTLYADGRIAFSYAAVSPSAAVVGISPGGLKGETAILDFRTDASAVYPAAVAEVFGDTLAVDVVTVAQQFYRTHSDAYDYLAVYNNLDIPAKSGGVVAYALAVRNTATGFGLPAFDSGAQFDSGSRLQAVLNLGPLSQYPAGPNGPVAARAQQHDTPLTILAHETGHRFLAYASVPGAADPAAQPMLGFQNAHWSFLFDSEASVVEGERIADRGNGVTPRFLTTDLAQGYAPLDQYLMGLRAAADVPGTFLIDNPAPDYPAAMHPYSGVVLDGTRRDIAVQDVIAAMGPRTPDDTVAQRRFRFAFIVVTAPGALPAPADLDKLNAWRSGFETFFAQAASGRASAETSLKRSLKLSLFPAAGVIANATAPATLTLETAAAADLAIHLSARNGNASVPALVTIPAGASAIAFQVSGIRAGVEEVEAAPADPAYETAFARVQVADQGQLKLTATSTDGRVAVRLTDANNLAYAGAALAATPSADGAVSPAEAFTDGAGGAAFNWSPGPEPLSTLRIAAEAAPPVSVTLTAGSAAMEVRAVVNAASLAPGIAPGSLAAVLGQNLTGAQMLLNGTPARALSTAPGRIDFYIPAETRTGPAEVRVDGASGAQAGAAAFDVVAAAPGIFPDGVRAAAGGAIHAGSAIEIYCTGLGASMVPTVFIGAAPVAPLFSGLAPGLPGVNQINLRIPADTPPGPVTLLISVDNARSNVVTISVE